MLKKTIEYVDFDERPRKEDFYFNLTKAEILELELSETGGLEAAMKRIAASQDGKEMIRIFKEVLRRAYGEREADGSFVKSDARFEKFSHTEAYSELVMEIMTDADKLATFISSLIGNGKVSPDEVRREMDKQMEELGVTKTNASSDATNPEQPTLFND